MQIKPVTNSNYILLSLSVESGVCHGNSGPLALFELKYQKLMIPLRHVTESRATFELEELRIESKAHSLAKLWLCPDSRTHVPVLEFSFDTFFLYYIVLSLSRR